MQTTITWEGVQYRLFDAAEARELEAWLEEILATYIPSPECGPQLADMKSQAEAIRGRALQWLSPSSILGHSPLEGDVADDFRSGAALTLRAYSGADGLLALEQRWDAWVTKCYPGEYTIKPVGLFFRAYQFEPADDGEEFPPADSEEPPPAEPPPGLSTGAKVVVGAVVGLGLVLIVKALV